MDDQKDQKGREGIVAKQVGLPKDASEETVELGKVLIELTQALEERFNEFERQARVGEVMDPSPILDQVLNQIFDSFRPTIPYDRIGLALLADDGDTARVRWARSDAPELKIEPGYSATLEGSSLQEVIETREPRILDDLEAYLEEHPESDSTSRIVEEGMRSSLTCPLITLTKPIGFLFFSSMERDAYQDIHQQVIRAVAGLLSMLVEKGRLYEELVELNWNLRVARDALVYQTSHDALTGLWSRPAIMVIAEKELHRSHREKKPMAMVLVDIDDFKQVNDSYGYQAGDVVLHSVAERLSDSLRSYEAVGRYGGSEFLIVLYSCDERGTLKVTKRLHDLIRSSEIETPAGSVGATISTGAAVTSYKDKPDAETLIRLADSALSKAKKTGRNRSEIATFQPTAPDDEEQADSEKAVAGEQTEDSEENSGGGEE